MRSKEFKSDCDTALLSVKNMSSLGLLREASIIPTSYLALASASSFLCLTIRLRTLRRSR